MARKRNVEDNLDWIELATRDYNNHQCIGNNFLEFFCAQRAMGQHAAAKHCEGILMDNEHLDAIELPKPQLPSDVESIMQADPALGNKILRQYYKAGERYTRWLASFQSIKSSYEKKQTTIHELFLRFFGPQVLKHVNHFLDRKEYFEAWNHLNDHFIGQAHLSNTSITTLYTTIEYDKRVPMSTFTNFMSMLFDVAGRLNPAGVMSDAEMVTWLVLSIKKGHSKGYGFVLDFIETCGKSYSEACQLLEEKELKYKTTRIAIGRNRGRGAESDPHENHRGSGDGGNNKKKDTQKPSNGDKFQAYNSEKRGGGGGTNSKNKKFTNSGKKGACHDCGQTGHWRGDDRCPNKDKSTRPSGKPSQRQANNTSSERSSRAGDRDHDDNSHEFKAIQARNEALERQLLEYQQKEKAAHNAHLAYERSFGKLEDDGGYYESNMVEVRFARPDPVYAVDDQQSTGTAGVSNAGSSPAVSASSEEQAMLRGLEVECNMAFVNPNWKSMSKSTLVASSDSPTSVPRPISVAPRASAAHRSTPVRGSLISDRVSTVTPVSTAVPRAPTLPVIDELWEFSPEVRRGIASVRSTKSVAPQTDVTTASSSVIASAPVAPVAATVGSVSQDICAELHTSGAAATTASSAPLAADESSSSDDDDEGDDDGESDEGEEDSVSEPVFANTLPTVPAVMNTLQLRRGRQFDVIVPPKKQASASNRFLPLAEEDEEANHVSSGLQSNNIVVPPAVKTTIFDTGCTHTMYGDKSKIQSLEELQPSPENCINFGGLKQFSLPIEGVGRTSTVKEVLFVPKLSKNLISGPDLMKAGYMQVYVGTRAYVYELSHGKLVDSGTLLEDNLVHQDQVPSGPNLLSFVTDTLSRIRHKPTTAKKLADGHFNPRLAQLTEKQVIYGSAVSRPANARSQVQNEWLVLHNRCGHASEQTLYNLVRHQTAIGACVTLADLKRDVMGLCSWCLLGRFNKFPAPASFSVKPTKPMEVIRSDIVGPFRTLSCFQSKYFQLHEDPVTGYLWINFHRVKSTASEDLMQLQSKFASPRNLRIKILQSDSDSIYKDQKLANYASSEGIILQYTAPYRHEGSIEARIQHVLNMMRTILADSNLAEKYWEPIAEACVYIINRLPSTKHPTSCAFTELNGTVPDISNFVPLGYPAVCKIYDEEPNPNPRTKLEPRGEKCRVLGYEESTPHALRVVTESGRLLIRKDVVVDENYTVHRNTKGPAASDYKYLLEPEPAVPRAVDDSVIAHKPEAPAAAPAPPMHREPSSRPRKPPDRLSLNASKTADDTLPPLPRNLKEAIAPTNRWRLEWLQALNKEMKEIIDRGVIQGVKKGETITQPFTSKIALRITRQQLANLESALKFKMRLVARGFSSIFGVHYDANYSPACLFKSLLVVMHIAKIEGWYKTNIDIGNAYLEAECKRDMYMVLPMDWTGGRKIVVRLARNLYGLKDAGLVWYLLVNKVLQEFNFVRSIYDPCIYYLMTKDGKRVILVLFVDDMAINCSDATLARIFKDYCKKIFKKITDAGDLRKFIGIEMADDGDYLLLSQKEITNQYVAEHVKRGRVFKSVPLAPMDDLERDGPDAPTEPIYDLTGKIRYLADRTRPDLLYAASRLGTKSTAAAPAYQDAALNVFRYLNFTKDLGLRLGGGDKEVKLFGYADASHVRNRDSKSQLGYCMYLSRDSGAVISRSTKDKTVSLSSTEAEIKALVECFKDGLWLRGLLAELGYPQVAPTVIYQDNQSGIRLAEKVGSENNTRHIINCINFIRQEIENKSFCLEYIPTGEMVADILTGPRGRGTFEYLRGILLQGHWIGKRKSN